MTKRTKDRTKSNGTSPDVYLVCEGDEDEILLAALTQRILRRSHSGISVMIVSAHGKQQIPGILRALNAQAEGKSRLGIAINSDGHVEAARSFLRRNLDLEDCFVVVADPSVESWFGREIRRLARDPKQTNRIVNQLDLDEIERKHPEVAVLQENLARRTANGSANRRRSATDFVHSHS